MLRLSRRLLTLLAVLALVAIPLAAGAGLCCAAPQTACCTQSCGDPGLCAGLPSAPAEHAQTAAPVAEAAAPFLTLTLLPDAPRPQPPAAHAPDRPRTPLSEGGACLHTTVLPPPVRA